MKAAMEAAMELEGRLDSLESTVKLLQESVGALQTGSAKKHDVDGLRQRMQSSLEELTGNVSQKADLEQLSQCLGAVRHELGEVIKRKANTEYVESSLQCAREDFAASLAGKADSGDVNRLTEQISLELSQKASDEEMRAHVQEQVRDARQKILPVAEECHKQVCQIAVEMKQKVDVEDFSRQFALLSNEVEKYVQCKTDIESLDRQLRDVFGSLSNKINKEEVASALISKVDKTCFDQRCLDLQASLETAASRSDLQSLELRAATLQQEMNKALQMQADVEALKHMDQTVGLLEGKIEGLHQALTMTPDRAEVEKCTHPIRQSVQALRQQLEESLIHKADAEHVRQLGQDLTQRVDLSETYSRAKLEHIERSCADLDQKFGDMEVAKADKSKVVEIVEAVRDEMLDLLKRNGSFEAAEERLAAALQVVAEDVRGKADKKIVERQLQHCREKDQELANLLADKANLDFVLERVKSVQDFADQLNTQMIAARQEFTTGVGRLSEMEQMGQRVEGMKREMLEVFKQITGSEHPGRCAPPDSSVESPKANQAHSWMSQRMILVKTELTKLVDDKADAEHVNQCVQAVKQEIADHVDQRIETARHELSEHVEKRAQATKKELTEIVSRKADTDLINSRFQDVEQRVEAVCKSKVVTSGGGGGLQTPLSLPEEYDDSRAAKVRRLLHELASVDTIRT